MFRDRFNLTGLGASVAKPLLEQLSSEPGALSQVSQRPPRSCRLIAVSGNEEFNSKSIMFHAFVLR